MEKDSPNGAEGANERPAEDPEEGPWGAGVPEGTPQGFGFRTGKRSSRVAYGFAVFILVIGTVLLVLGGILLAREGQWVGVGLLVLVEAAFIAGFRALARQARRRRNG
jgi:hypothetical protein